MKRIMKRNQVVITALAVMLAVAGYLTYSGKQDFSRLSEEQVAVNATDSYDTYVAGKNNDETNTSGQNTGETNVPAQSKTEEVSAETTAAETETAASGSQSALQDIKSMDYDIEDPGEAVLASGMTVNDYLASARLAREQIRGKNKEALLQIIDNETMDSVDRQAAVDKMVELADNSDKECAAETLLSAKGFDNSIVSITEGKVDVVICQEQLSDAELAQIEDIVKRKADVSAAEIVISLMNVNQ